MTQFRIALEPAAPGVDRGYDLKLGPMWFTAPVDALSEGLGDGLETVGAAIVPAERRPRPLKLKLPVRVCHREPRAREGGLEMRREVRALLNNARWRLGGLYVWFEADPDLEGWYLIGGGDLEETDEGLTFGDFTLELSDVYRVGQPGTHKPGRRLELADRRGGTVPRDTRRLIYSTDFNTQALPAEPLFLPGDVVNALGTGGRTPASTTTGPTIRGRHQWRSVAAVSGETVSYLPDDAFLPDPLSRYRDLDEPGSVRVWCLDGITTYPPVPTSTPERSVEPTLDGWQPVYGDVLRPTTRLAVDNGACRVVWLGPDIDEGLAIERADTDGAYIREARVLAGGAVRESRVVEMTPERAVLEWRGGARVLRAVLQRGWPGPRLEAYDDDDGDAALEFAAHAGDLASGAAQTPSWVSRLEITPSDGRAAEALLVAKCTVDDAIDTTPEFIDGPAVCFRRTRAIALQVDVGPRTSAAAVASLSLVDAQAIPTLVGR